MHLDPPQHRIRNIALLCMLAVLHGALLLLGLRSTILISARHEADALQLLTLPRHPSAFEHAGAALAGAALSDAAPVTPPRSRASPGRPQQPPAAGQAAPEPAATIDWTQQAQSVAQIQTELAALPGPRRLDDRERHEVPGSKPAKPAPQFGWDQVHAHRVQASGGAVFIRLNDRCTLVLMPLPLFGCGIGGDIPIRGDLFDHMRDAPPLGAPPAGAP